MLEGRPRLSSSLRTVSHGYSTQGNKKIRDNTRASQISMLQTDSKMPSPVERGAPSASMNPKSQNGVVLPALVIAGPPVKLSPEQESVLQRVKSGQNVFFTGSAGQRASEEVPPWYLPHSRMGVQGRASPFCFGKSSGSSEVHVPRLESQRPRELLQSTSVERHSIRGLELVWVKGKPRT